MFHSRKTPAAKDRLASWAENLKATNVEKSHFHRCLLHTSAFTEITTSRFNTVGLHSVVFLLDLLLVRQSCQVSMNHAPATSSSTAMHGHLTPSMLAAPNRCCLTGLAPYWSNPPFLIFDTQAFSLHWVYLIYGQTPKQCECRETDAVTPVIT